MAVHCFFLHMWVAVPLKRQLLFMQLVSLDKERICVITDRSSVRGIYVYRCCLCTDLFINYIKLLFYPLFYMGVKFGFLL